MSWTHSQSWASSLMGPTPLAIGVAILLVLSVPLFLHLVIYRSSSSTTLPSFLLVGPSGAGKTALLTLVRTLFCLGFVLTEFHSSKEASTLKPAFLKFLSALKCPFLSQRRPRRQNTDRSTIPPIKPTKGFYSPILQDMGSYGTTLSTASSSHKI